MAYSDNFGGFHICDTKPRQVGLHRRIQLDLACFDQLHDGECGKGFASGTSEKWRLWGDWTARPIGYPKCLQMDNLITLHNDKRRARNTKLFHFSADVGVDCVKLGKLGLGEARHDAKYDESKKRSAQEDDFAKHVCCSQKLTKNLLLYRLANEFNHLHYCCDRSLGLFNHDAVTALFGKELLAVSR